MLVTFVHLMFSKWSLIYIGHCKIPLPNHTLLMYPTLKIFFFLNFHWKCQIWAIKKNVRIKNLKVNDIIIIHELYSVYSLCSALKYKGRQYSENTIQYKRVSEGYWELTI